MKLIRLALALAASFVLASGAGAADLAGWSSKRCVFAAQSTITELPVAEIEATVAEYRATASEALQSEAVVFSTRPVFTWAQATEFQCNKALGYLIAGHLDEDSAQKCDCFYQRMISFR